MNMISKEKYNSLVASGYYDITSSSKLLKIPLGILEDLFRYPSYKEPTVEDLKQRLPEGTDIYDYGDICHKLVSNGYDLRHVYFFLLRLAWYGYNFKLKNGENDYTALQEFLLHLETGPVNAFNYSCYGPGGNYSSSAIDIFSFFQSRVGINVKDKFGNSILHTLIIDCRYKESIVQILITIAQRFESENFDFECKNNRNMGIIETLDECINKYSKSNDKSVQEKGKLLSDESEEIKKIINGLIKYKKDQSRIISEKDKNNKTEIEIYEIQDKISFILENTPFYEKSDYFSETHNAFKEIVDDMKYYRNKITNNIVFDLDTILAVKKAMDMEYKIILSYFPGLTRTFPSPIFLQSAAMKARKCIRNDKENEEEVTARRNLNEIIERFLEKIVYQLSFMDIIENKNIILLFKKTLKENFDYIIEHTDNMETEKDFIFAWSKYEERIKETIRFGIKVLKVPANVNKMQEILQALEEFGFNEEIDLLNKKIGNITDETNKIVDCEVSILAPVKEEYKNQIKKILNAGLESLTSSPDISTMNIMLQALEACGLNEEAEFLKKIIKDYTAGNFLEEIIEDEIKTGKLSNLGIVYLQKLFKNNGFENVSELIEQNKEEKGKAKKIGKISD